ncbi:N-acyl-D-amino-acid deacylase family protein [Fusibacter ferrireducens]|uniref:D-aminoacylase n=1 Tax=Fusibacter ferrireducens TaxID=2785058 RepID=A0ABR9ZXY5_9FIRM|nr:D-aminoacylase [Fusibacter ferrireducens]MBF4694429.1 D-aminoacylase [Fusibacter ferrireducens]
MLDIAINNGRIVDGTGEKSYIASIGIKDKKIVEINKNNEILSGKNVIDASGLIVSPGFIDMHSHSDWTFLMDNRSESKVLQGVTTEVIGNCGNSIVPNTQLNLAEVSEYANIEKVAHWRLHTLGDYIEKLREIGLSINCAPLIGHGTLRKMVMGFDNRRPNEAEMQQMKALLSRELETGAWGMSAGLIYPPGCFSDRAELIELGKVLKAHDALFTAHIRGESDAVFEAVKEMIEIGRGSGVHVHISHLKLMGKDQWGKAEDLLDLIHQYASEGGLISCDQYPYTASMTSLKTLVPEWAHEGGIEKMLENLRGKDEQKILEGIDVEMNKRGGPEKVVIGTVSEFPEWEGRNIQQISDQMALEPAHAVRVILEKSNGTMKAIYHTMDEEDVKRIMKHMNISVGSDGYGIDYEGKIYTNQIHPRSFGTFPRFLKFTRENELLSMEKSIYKITGLAANQLGIKDRGKIKQNHQADLVIFDYEKIADTATFMNPISKPEGIHHVIVSGELIVQNGVQTEAKNGEVLLKTAVL